MVRDWWCRLFGCGSSEQGSVGGNSEFEKQDSMKAPPELSSWELWLWGALDQAHRLFMRKNTKEAFVRIVNLFLDALKEETVQVCGGS